MQLVAEAHAQSRRAACPMGAGHRWQIVCLFAASHHPQPVQSDHSSLGINHARRILGTAHLTSSHLPHQFPLSVVWNVLWTHVPLMCHQISMNPSLPCVIGLGWIIVNLQLNEG